MSIRDLILNVDELDDDATVYAKRINGKFEGHSEVALLELSNEDLELLTRDIAEKYCPGFDYFSEAHLIKEMVEDIRVLPEYQTTDQQVERVIYYAEFMPNPASSIDSSTP